MITHLHRIGEGNVKDAIELHPGTAIFGQDLIGISTVHLAIRKIAPLIPKALTLYCEYLRIELSLGLFLDFVETVAVYE